MKTLILNGSPKGNTKNCGSFMISKAMAKGIKKNTEICAIRKADYQMLYEKLAEVDNVIFIIPVYIHSVPGFILDFLYGMPKKTTRKCAIGFILQSGFPESSESEIAARFLKRFIEKTGYDYLGCVIKGECAGLAIMPEKYGKLLGLFEELGVRFERTGEFDRNMVREFAEPKYLSKFQCRFLNFIHPLANYLGWGRMLKKNKAYEQRLDMPYLSKH